MVRPVGRLEIVLAGPALLLAAALAMAQGRPDFSGRWTAVPPSSPAAGDRGTSDAAAATTMGSGWGASLTIEHNASTLVVERAQFSQYDMQPPLRLTYALDGSESTNTINMGRGPQELVSKGTWQDSSLVITTRFRFSNPRTGAAETSDLTQVLSLDPSGSLVVTTTLGAALGGPGSTTSTIYKKGS